MVLYSEFPRDEHFTLIYLELRVMTNEETKSFYPSLGNIAGDVRCYKISMKSAIIARKNIFEGDIKNLQLVFKYGHRSSRT